MRWRVSTLLFLLPLVAGCPDFPAYLLVRDRGPIDLPDGPLDGQPRRDGPGAIFDGPRPVPGTWVTIGAGTYLMGSPLDEPCRSNNETQHQVTLTRGVLISATEVTQAQFQQVLSYHPAKFISCGSSCPVENVSWHEAAAYCNALSGRAQLSACYTCTGSGAAVSCDSSPAFAGAQVLACPGYRLPSEAEWEHAYRAGTLTALYSGTITANCNNGKDPNADALAWYDQLSPSPVAVKQPNAWQLFDLAGNVREWTHDWETKDLGSAAAVDPWGAPSGKARVCRGGSWSQGLKYLRAAARQGAGPGDRADDLGFRCVRSK